MIHNPILNLNLTPTDALEILFNIISFDRVILEEEELTKQV